MKKYIPLSRFKRELTSIIKRKDIIYIVTRNGKPVAVYTPSDVLEAFNVLGIVS